MKYLIMVYLNPEMRAAWASFSDEQRAQGWAAHAAVREELIASGELVHSEALVDPTLGKQVAVREGQVLTTDGPFAEAKEALAGFYLVECDSLERAMEHAARLPEAQFATVEVRPVLSMRGDDM
jgi:hypothetical protein